MSTTGKIEIRIVLTLDEDKDLYNEFMELKSLTGLKNNSELGRMSLKSGIKALIKEKTMEVPQ